VPLLLLLAAGATLAAAGAGLASSAANSISEMSLKPVINARDLESVHVQHSLLARKNVTLQIVNLDLERSCKTAV
jgi:hypothetical protein